MSHSTPGFIVFEGPEGAGKSTQIELLRARLAARGDQVVLARDPGSTAIGERIRAILLDPACSDMGMRAEMLLYMAARAQMMSQIILPALNEGKIVLCDRFVSSTLAYQGGGEGLAEQEIRNTADVAIQGRWPDLVVLLDMPPHKSMARVKRGKDRIEQRPIEYHQRVRANYLKQAADEPDRFRVIDADRAVEAVAQEVWSACGAVDPMT
jgi:dTMP kinase